MRIVKLNESVNPKYLYYYCFDWDDNILHMPTEIIIQNDKSELVGIPTSDFAKFRDKLTKNEPFKYKEHTIVGYPKLENGKIDFETAYSNFIDSDDENVFINDVKKAIRDNAYGPAWQDFIECLTHGSLFAIITARGHESDTIREAVEWIVDTQLTDDQQQLMYNHLLRYAYLFGKEQDYEEYERIPKGQFSDTELVTIYLDNCDYIGIASPTRGGTPDNPEKAKEKALLEFKEKVNKFAGSIGLKAKIGFSDDDLGNVAHIEDLFKNLNHEKYSNIIHYVVKNTNIPHDVKKTEIKVESIKTLTQFYETEDKGMYMDGQVEREAIRDNAKSSTTSSDAVITLSNKKSKGSKKGDEIATLGSKKKKK